MKNILLTVFLLWQMSIANAQSKCDCFNRIYNLASIAQSQDEYLERMKDAVSFLDAPHSAYYFLIIADYYAQKGNVDSATVYYKKILPMGYDLLSVKESCPACYNKLDTVKFKKLDAERKAKIDFKLLERFNNAEAIDQYIRSSSVINANIKDTTDPRVKMVDEINIEQAAIGYEFVTSVLDKYGYPDFYKTGFSPGGFWAIVLHVTAYESEQSTQLIHRLDSLNKAGDLPEKSNILFLKDRQYLYNHQKGLVGMIGVNRFFNIENYTNIDSLRFQYNMLKLQDDYEGSGEANGKKLPDAYKPMPYPKNYFCLKKYSNLK